MNDHPNALALSPAILAILASAPVTDTWAGALSTAQQTARALSGSTDARPLPPPVLLVAYAEEITFDRSHGSHRSHSSHSSHSSHASHYSGSGGGTTPPPPPIVTPPPAPRAPAQTPVPIATTPAVAKPALPPGSTPANKPMWTSLQDLSDLSEFRRCCEAADLAKLLTDPSKTFTVFAFTDTAFASATTSTTQAEGPPKPALAKLAAANITDTAVLLPASISPGMEVRMLNYDIVPLTALSSGVLMRGRKSVRTIVVDRGVIYVFSDLVYAP